MRCVLTLIRCMRADVVVPAWRVEFVRLRVPLRLPDFAPVWSVSCAQDSNARWPLGPAPPAVREVQPRAF